ncbi:MAG: universal stress protein [Bryobacteraceae bacterium]|nr:universal stress protein [Bryobacteraceae bacterium]
MFPFRRVLVALAGTATDAGLLDYAAMLGEHCSGVEFRCTHVAATEEAVERAECIREVVEKRLREAARANQVVCDITHGAREDRLLELVVERRAELILLGHRPGGSGRRSLARRLAMKAPCSVWMAPEGSSPRLRRILVPIDFSRRSADAVVLTTRLAESMGIDEAQALHVFFDEAAVSYDEYGEVMADTHDLRFHLFVAPIDLHGVYLKSLFVEGSIVAHTVLRIAGEEKIDLIVMGTRGRSRSSAVLLGSETEHVIRESNIPVLAVKHFGARLRVLAALLDRRRRASGWARFT